ncbi:MAG: ABC transporter substrate-binding protein [Rhodospirillaceae bacterium]|nr:ABC transporter substrate-binding protein [Rhodospirillaceae bacterium]
MHGQPKYPENFTSFEYVNPNAKKGGTLRLHAIGTYDTLNPYIIKGKSAAGLHHSYGYFFETLTSRSKDEPFSLYGLIAETIETPNERDWVEFKLRKEARFSDGKPITVEDVIFSWNTLKKKGSPNARATWSRINEVIQTGPRKVKFIFLDNKDRELPLLIAGFLPVLSKSWWSERNFSETTLDKPISSGPYVISEAIPGRSITFHQNKNYWGKNLPVNNGRFNFDFINFTYYRDDSVALEAFKAGDYDYRRELNAARWATQYSFPAINKGNVIRETVDKKTPAGLNALVFNLRKSFFSDIDVRKALNLAFDFEWINRALLHQAYTRTRGMFDNSELSPNSLPSKAEILLLNPWRERLPKELFTTPFKPMTTDGSGTDRLNLRKAVKLLKKSGFIIKNKTLVGTDGVPVEIEITLRRRSNEKIALAYARNLKKLGISASVRLVESAQFQNIINDYDFDMVFGFWGVTLSPGNEQQNYWSSITANQTGGRNWAGISDPVINSLISNLQSAYTNEELVTAARALDRVLMWNYYLLPLYHDSYQRFAYWQKLSRPKIVPIYGIRLQTFWNTNSQ